MTEGDVGLASCKHGRRAEARGCRDVKRLERLGKCVGKVDRPKRQLASVAVGGIVGVINLQ